MMDKAGTYVGCLGLMVMTALLTGFLAKFMNWRPAMLISCLVLSFVFVSWFGLRYHRLLSQKRLGRPDDFKKDD